MALVVGERTCHVGVAVVETHEPLLLHRQQTAVPLAPRGWVERIVDQVPIAMNAADDAPGFTIERQIIVQVLRSSPRHQTSWSVASSAVGTRRTTGMLVQ